MIKRIYPASDSAFVHERKDVRFSGREYTNSLEKLEVIKEKYKDGVRPKHVEALVEAWLRGV